MNWASYDTHSRHCAIGVLSPGGTLSATSEETTAMSTYVVTALAAELMTTVALIARRHRQALDTGPTMKTAVDGSIRPDGSWQRCLPLLRGQLYCG